jgi:hypothetical protein
MRLSIAVVAVTILLSAGPARPAAAQNGVVARDLATHGDIGYVKTDGRLAVWNVDGADLMVADLGSGQIKTLDTNSFMANYAVSGGRVAWTNGGELRIYDAASGTTSALPLPAGFKLFDLHGDTLVWMTQTGAPPDLVQAVWARNIATMTPPVQVFSRPDTLYGSYSLKSNGTVAVWAQAVSQSHQAGLCYELYAARLDGSSPPARLDTGPCSGAFSNFTLNSDTVFYRDFAGILYAYQLGGGSTAISDAILFGAFDLQISGDYLVGNQYVDRAGSVSDLQLWAYDLRNKTKWVLASYPASNQYVDSVAIGGAAVVWSDHSATERVVRVRPIDAVTPAAPRSANDPLVQGRSYYEASRHSLGGRFERYWGRNGGLAVFGYPLTEEFRQQNPDTGVTYDVQYLERQRYEYHPENAGTAYEILLGRLGAELLEQSGRDWRSEGDDQPGAQPLPGECQSFATTNRSVCGAFLDYWRSHGLDLGQRGVSYDESLALFGYPLTAPRLETNPDGDTVLTQWFERARFEWHPNNPAEYQVLLGRLAAEQLPAFGW